MYACIRTSAHPHISTHIRRYVHTCTRRYVHTCTWIVDIHVHGYTHIHIRTRGLQTTSQTTCMYVPACACMYVPAYVRTCVVCRYTCTWIVDIQTTSHCNPRTVICDVEVPQRVGLTPWLLLKVPALVLKLERDLCMYAYGMHVCVHVCVHACVHVCKSQLLCA